MDINDRWRDLCLKVFWYALSEPGSLVSDKSREQREDRIKQLEYEMLYEGKADRPHLFEYINLIKQRSRDGQTT